MKILVIIILFFNLQLPAQELPRRATWQASFQNAKGSLGKVVKEIEPDSPLEKSGFQKGDIILRVNHTLIQSSENWTSVTYALREKQEVQLLVRRGTEILEKSVALNGMKKEVHPGLDTYYTSVVSDYGIRQRVIITKPQNATGKLPAVFLVQGLSCSSIENSSEVEDNWDKMIREMVESTDMVLLRIEKPGVGDSEGDCATSDFFMDLEGYRAAIRHLKSLDYVDNTKIVVYGSSMGSALAPLLANEFNLAGVISDGTFFKTWFEHMLEIERRIRQMQGDDESTIVKKMNEAYIPLYYGMLIQKKSYQEVIDEYPAIAEYNYHSPEHMYGRSMQYYQQLQEFDLAGQWAKLKVPVRILYGSNDWIMSEFDSKMIMDVLDKAGHQDHKLVIYPGLDHWNTIHEKPVDSFSGKPGKWDPEMPKLVVGWARAMVGLD